MAHLRTANQLSALAGDILRRAETGRARHPNASDSLSAALNVIGFMEGCSNGALARALKLSHPATARLVEKLVADGLVVTARGDDRRSVALRLTEAGRLRARDVVSERVRAVADLLDRLTVEQIRALDDILDTLLRRVATGLDEALHVCRLCDGVACPPERCPVHAIIEAATAS